MAVDGEDFGGAGEEPEFDTGASAGGDEGAGASADDAGGEESGEGARPKRGEPESRKVALRAERTKRREAERRANELAAQMARMEQTFQQFVSEAGGGRGGQAREEDLDIETRPIDALRALHTKVQTYEQRERQLEQAQQQQAKQQQAIARLEATFQEHEDDFAEDVPDYGDASKFVVEGRVAELQEMGYGRAQAAQIVRGEILQMAAINLQRGRNPAEALYAAAKARGFKPAGASGADKFEQIRQGERASRSLSNGGRPGGGGGGQITLAQLSNLKGAAFDKAYEQYSRQMRGRG